MFSINNFELKEVYNSGRFILSNHNSINSRHTFFKIDESGEPYNQAYIYQPIGGSTGGSHKVYERGDSAFDVIGLHYTYINGNPQSVLFANRRDSTLQTSLLSRFYDINTTVPPGVLSCLNIDSTYVLSGGFYVQPNNMYYPMLIKLDHSLGIAWSQSYRDRMGYVQDIARAPDGGWYLLMQLANEGMALAKTDSTGMILWSKSYTQPFRYPNSLKMLQDGDLIVTGYKNPGIGFAPIEPFLIKVDMYGQVIWSKTYGDSFNSFYKAAQNPTFYVDTANNNNIILTGIFKRQWQSRSDIVAAVLDNNGDIIWSRCYGNEFFDEFGSICHQTTDGGFIIGGYNNYQINNFPPVQNIASVTVIKTDSLGYSDGCMEYPVTIYSEPDTPLVTNLTWSIYVDSIVTEIPSNMIDTTGTPTRNENMCTFVSLMEPDELVERLDVFPNPSVGVFIVQSAHTIDRVEVSDITGRMILSNEYLNSQNIELNLTGRPPGVYLAKIYSGQRLATVKLALK